jgi:hypothetical protein
MPASGISVSKPFRAQISAHSAHSARYPRLTLDKVSTKTRLDANKALDVPYEHLFRCLGNYSLVLIGELPECGFNVAAGGAT